MEARSVGHGPTLSRYREARVTSERARTGSASTDDPRNAMPLIAQITGVLVSAVQERERSLRGGWGSGRAGTEGLRNALREYQPFFERPKKMEVQHTPDVPPARPRRPVGRDIHASGHKGKTGPAART